jgi:putative tryptophan/tyrosine transport system substrate-binding protein
MLANPLCCHSDKGQRMPVDQLKRRAFISLLSGTVVAWPLAARAQQPAMPVIGFVHLTSLETTHEYLAAFHLGLGDTGYIVN